MSNFTSWQQHEAFVEQYGEPYVSILDQCLGIITAVANHVLSETEARAKALAMFEELMPLHVTACHKRIAAYQARVAAEQAEATRVSVLAYERRERMRLAEEQRQRDLAAAHDKAQRDAYERSQEEVRAHRERFAQGERDRQSAIDKKMQAEAEDIERRIAAVEGQQ